MSNSNGESGCGIILGAATLIIIALLLHWIDSANERLTRLEKAAGIHCVETSKWFTKCPSGVDQYK